MYFSMSISFRNVKDDLSLRSLLLGWPNLRGLVDSIQSLSTEKGVGSLETGFVNLVIAGFFRGF